MRRLLTSRATASPPGGRICLNRKAGVGRMRSFTIGTKYLLPIVLIVGSLFFAPVVPTCTLFAWSSVSKGRSRNQSNLTASDFHWVLRLIKDHKMYGIREGMPIYVSLEDLLFGNQSFGILQIRDIARRSLEWCPDRDNARRGAVHFH